MVSKSLSYALVVLFVLAGAAVVFFVVDGGSSSPQIEGIGAERTRAVAAELDDDGEPVPDFQLETLAGDTFRVSDHLDQVLVLNFWATWCAPCRVEIPDLIEIQSEMGERGVQIVGISLDHEGDAAVRAFAEEHGINYPIAVDDGAVADAFGGVYALPTTFIVDADGIIRKRITGLTTRETLAVLLDDLLDA